MPSTSVIIASCALRRLQSKSERVDVALELRETPTEVNSSSISSSSSKIVDLSLATFFSISCDDLYKLIEQHKLHLLFLKENDLCSDAKKKEIVEKIEGVFDIISNRTNNSNNNLVSK